MQDSQTKFTSGTDLLYGESFPVSFNTHLAWNHNALVWVNLDLKYQTIKKYQNIKK